MKVHIYSPAKSAMQSGLGRTEGWMMVFEGAGQRKPEDLMGWTSSCDTNAQIRLRFPDLPSAVAFATKKGWGYEIAPAHVRKVTPRSYLDSFRIPPARP